MRLRRGETGVSKSVDLSFPRAIEASGHHGSTYFEHIALMDRLEGKRVDSATPMQGIWAMIVASAAQKSLADALVVDVEAFIATNGLTELLSQ